MAIFKYSKHVRVDDEYELPTPAVIGYNDTLSEDLEICTIQRMYLKLLYIDNVNLSEMLKMLRSGDELGVCSAGKILSSYWSTADILHSELYSHGLLKQC